MWLSKRKTGPQTGLKSSTLASDANLVKKSLNLGDFNCHLAEKNTYKFKVILTVHRC
jgi:hypothetical protein